MSDSYRRHLTETSSGPVAKLADPKPMFLNDELIAAALAGGIVAARNCDVSAEAAVATYFKVLEALQARRNANGSEDQVE